MRKHDESLFQIGEVSKIVGISRKVILNYEDLGLLTPAVKDKDSGYRYYTADDIAKISSIRSLQLLGLSLKEIAGYYYDFKNIENNLTRLMELRASVDRNIQALQLRAAQPGDLTVRWTRLPRQVCFCRRYQCVSVAEATMRLRDTYVAAARSGKISMRGRMFTVRMGADVSALDILCCIPVLEEFDGPERQVFPETPALCIYYRGSYDGVTSAIRTLLQHMHENRITAVGDFRSIYLEGPPTRGGNSVDYVTQVAVPIAERRHS